MSSSGFANRHLVNRKAPKVSMPTKEALDLIEAQLKQADMEWHEQENTRT